MKRYLALFISSLLGLAGLAYVYFHSRGTLGQTHQEIVDLLNSTRQSEVEINQDILRIQNFMLQDYDSIAREKENLEKFCAADNAIVKAHPTQGSNFQIYFKEYCQAVAAKIVAIEDFKSINSVYRNSLLFLHGQAIEWQSQNLFVQLPEVEKFRRQLTYIGLTYSLLSDENTKLLAASRKEYFLVRKFPKHISSEHALKLIDIKPRRDQATQQIVDAPTRVIFEKLRYSYFEEFQKEQKKILFFQNLLLGLCLALIIFVIFNVIKIWQVARALHNANEHLEERVRARTEELSASQQTIVDQQERLALTAKMSALGEMAGGVAHEINTPLAVIQMRTEQVLENLEEEELDKELLANALRAIDDTVKRIAKIINGLRSFARDGRKDPISLYSISKIVDETFSLCRERFNNHGVQLEYIHKQDIEIPCRSVEISQVLLNLLNNSYDAIQSFSDKWIRVELIEQPDTVLLSVRDCGQGIPQEIRDKMMQPFFTTKEIGKGTGLGLSISRGIIESHGGSIQINSKSANTEIIITLPRQVASDVSVAG
ncbi:MAG: DAHL domain-containing protein [Bdellovibrionota bacterium]